MAYTCKYCGRICKTAQALSYHQNRCKLNSNAKHDKAWNRDVWTIERLNEFNHNKFNDKFTFILDNKIEFSRWDKIKIICPDDGEIEQTIIQFINSPEGCIKCSKRKAALNKSKEDLDKWRYSRLSNLETWKKKCSEIHNDKYDYSLCTEYMGNRTIMKIICPIHGKFYQSAYKHIAGQGCKKCSLIERQKNRHETIKLQYIQKLKNKYPEFDFSIFDYDEKCQTGKIKCICPKHGEIYLTRSGRCQLCTQEEKDNKNINELINIIENETH